MSKINGIQHTPNVTPLRAGTSASKPQPQTSQSEADTVEISPQARLASLVANIPDVRQELVARVREEIQAGTYESQQKLEIAIDRLMEEMDL